MSSTEPADSGPDETRGTAARSAHRAGAPLTAIALEGAGWHPAAWRAADARPAELTSPRYWRDVVRLADDAHADLVTIEDSLAMQSSTWGADDDRVDQVRGRLDALLIAAYVAPRTRRVGLVPTVTTTHTEPFHVATGLQTLDWASRGRAGWRVQVSLSPVDAALVGRRATPKLTLDDVTSRGDELLVDSFGEAREAVAIARRLWDSWEDNAIVRDVATGRFVDRARIHEIGFRGAHLSVAGASITPRSPQGQLIVTALAHQRVPYELAATSADLVFVTPHDDAGAARILGEVRDAEARVGRATLPFVGGRSLDVLADLLVVVDERPGEARRELERLDELAGEALTSDARIFAGTPDELVDLVRAWHGAGYAGVRLRPARIPADLRVIADRVLPALGATDRPGATLRERLGYGRPDSTYADDDAAAADAAAEDAAADDPSTDGTTSTTHSPSTTHTEVSA